MRSRDFDGERSVTATPNQSNKHAVWEFWRALEAAGDDRVEVVARDYLDADLTWKGFDPVNALQGVEAFVSGFWSPLHRSFPDLKRQTHVFLGGKSNGRIDGLRDGHRWVCGTGYLNGTFARDYLAIPATGVQVSIRWGEFCRMEQGRIVEIYFLLDLIDLMQQAGFPVLPPSRGIDSLFPPPRRRDGILLDGQDEVESRRSLDHIRRFIFNGLNQFDESKLESMGMADFFHPDLQWYGPGGIGACLSFQDFQSQHQQPWLHAFPNRQIQNLDALFAEGSYSAAPGWKGVMATHAGEYLGCPPTGKLVEINGLDYWKREGEQYVENWVFVDMIHLFRQLGVDLFERLSATSGVRGHRDSSEGAGCADCTGCCAAACAERVREIVKVGAGRVSYNGNGADVPVDLGRYIDHTLLKPDATAGDIDRICDEAAQCHFAAVCLNPTWIRHAAARLRGTGVGIASVVGFPLGANNPRIKAAEARQALRDGASEIDMVLNIGALKSQDYDLVQRDIRGVADACREVGALCKVILETALLTDEEKVVASRLARAAKAHFVKTSSGFSEGGATAFDVALLCEAVGPTMGVKASGGIRSAPQDAQEMIAVGATRIGASAGVEMMTGGRWRERR